MFVCCPCLVFNYGIFLKIFNRKPWLLLKYSVANFLYIYCVVLWYRTGHYVFIWIFYRRKIWFRFVWVRVCFYLYCCLFNYLVPVSGFFFSLKSMFAMRHSPNVMLTYLLCILKVFIRMLCIFLWLFTLFVNEKNITFMFASTPNFQIEDH